MEGKGYRQMVTTKATSRSKVPLAKPPKAEDELEFALTVKLKASTYERLHTYAGKQRIAGKEKDHTTKQGIMVIALLEYLKRNGG